MTASAIPTQADVERLHARSEALRALATTIEAAPLLDLARRAGPDTWCSPAADQCRAELAADHRRLLLAADDLRTTAWILDRQAAELELAVRLAAIG